MSINYPPVKSIVPEGNPTIEDRVAAIEAWVDKQRHQIHKNAVDGLEKLRERCRLDPSSKACEYVREAEDAIAAGKCF